MYIIPNERTEKWTEILVYCDGLLLLYAFVFGILCMYKPIDNSNDSTMSSQITWSLK